MTLEPFLQCFFLYEVFILQTFSLLLLLFVVWAKLLQRWRDGSSGGLALEPANSCSSRRKEWVLIGTFSRTVFLSMFLNFRRKDLALVSQGSHSFCWTSARIGYCLIGIINDWDSELGMTELACRLYMRRKESPSIYKS